MSSCAFLVSTCSTDHRAGDVSACRDPEPQGDFEEGITYETSKGVQPVKSFDDMSLKPDLLRGIYQYGFEKPSAIQQRAIGPILGTRDVIAQAQSGTGKTSMIALALCQKVDNRHFKYGSFSML